MFRRRHSLARVAVVGLGLALIPLGADAQTAPAGDAAIGAPSATDVRLAVQGGSNGAPFTFQAVQS